MSCDKKVLQVLIPHRFAIYVIFLFLTILVYHQFSSISLEPIGSAIEHLTRQESPVVILLNPDSQRSSYASNYNWQ